MLRKCLTFLFLITVYQSLAQQDEPILSFIENKGQWPVNVLFMATPNAQTSLFIEKDRITITHTEKKEHSHPHHDREMEEGGHTQNEDCNHLTIKHHTYSILFDNGNCDNFSVSNPSPDYLNYFTGEKQISNAHRYQEVTLNNIWDGISLHIGQINGSIKFDWYLKPRSDASMIKLRYVGVDGLNIVDGSLRVKTSLGVSEEKRPTAWLKDTNEGVIVEYKLTEDLLQFETNWDGREELIIDPELVFSTYSGSFADNWGYTATSDNNGNVFSGGIVDGIGYPVTVGAWQSSFGGNWDIGIIKYNTTGTQRLWASYLGGNQGDMPHSMICDQNGNLILMGTTGSANYPTTSGAYSQSFKGGKNLNYDWSIAFPSGSDIIISKLSADGTQLIGSTFLGGSGNDGLNYKKNYENLGTYGNDSLYYSYGDGARGEVSLDENQNIYIASSTFSANFPTTPGVAQTNYKGGQEGVICKLSPSLTTLLWSTYWGGNKDDALFSLDVDDGFIVAAGATLSTNLATTPGALRPTFQGGTGDGMVVTLNKSNGTLMNASYFGTPSLDLIYFARTDSKSDIYLFGCTKDHNNLLYSGNVYTNAGSGQYIAKLSPTLDTLRWCGLFGSGRPEPEISPTAFEIDRCNRIMLSGWGRYWGGASYQGVPYNWYGNWGTTGFPITPDAIQSTTDGQDFYIAVFESNFSDLLFGTFYGELHTAAIPYSGRDHVDGGTSRFDSNGNIIQSVCASCGGSDLFPTFPNPGAWSNTNNNSNCNNAVFKINLSVANPTSEIIASGAGCYPDTVHFHATNSPETFRWDFGDPTSGSLNHSTLPTPHHIYTAGGNYQVTLIVGWPGTCNAVDTIVSQVTVVSDSNYYIGQVTACFGDSIQIGIAPSADTTIQYRWYPATGLSDSTSSNPLASPLATTLYLLTTSYGGNCTDSIHQWFIVDPHTLTVPHQVVTCDTIVTLSATSPPGTLFQWSSNALFSDTLNTTLSNPAFIASGWGFQTFYIRSTGSGGCQLVDSTLVNFSFDTIAIHGSAKVCSQDTILYTLTYSSDTIQSITWSPPELLISGQGEDTVYLIANTAFLLKVNLENQFGCIFKDSLLIDVRKPSISLQAQDPLCNGDCNGWISPILANGFPPYHYQWNTGDTTSLVDSLCQGVYQVYVTDELGCKDTAGVTLVSPSPLALQVISNEPLCNNSSDGTITIIPDGGIKPYRVVIFGDTLTGDTLTIFGLHRGVYSLVIHDRNGCTIDRLVSLNAPPPIIINPIITEVACKGDSTGVIALEVSGGTEPFRFNWENGATTSEIKNLKAGIYNVTITDLHQCDTSLSITIKEPLMPLVYTTETTSTSCFETNDGAIILTASGGVLPYSIIWENGQTGFNLTGLKRGVIAGTLTDSAGCILTVVDTITSPLRLDASFSMFLPSCPENSPDGKIMVTINGGTIPYSIMWQNGQSGSICDGLLAGTHSVEITDQNNCKLDTIAQLEAPPGYTLQKKVLEPLCYGGDDGKIELIISGGTGPFLIKWDNGMLGAEILHLKKGEYFATIYDGKGCKDTLGIHLHEPAAISVEEHVTDALCPNTLTGAIEIIAEGGTPPLTITWKDKNMEFIRYNIRDGIYEYTINDLNFCKVTDTVKVNNAECEIEIPNVITPNGDNINDILIIKNIEYQYDNKLIIYNRWGNVIREYMPYQNKWDGTDSDGNSVPEGTYFYILWLIDGRHFQGSINVER